MILILIRRWLERILIGVLVTAALSFALDWTIFTLRGKPQDQVVINRYLAVPLKGNKTEYEYQGSLPTACSRSLYPQAGMTPCWYLRKHTTQFQRL